jgi:2-amino-4-hydroxy-6-hydroxymethyldihydropteridine diphosphokinase
MHPVTVYLSLGSNIGDREANLRTAIESLPAAGAQVLRVSGIYETEPVDYLDQAWFLNCVVEAQTELPAIELLRQLRAIEARMGSRKLVPRGPRLIDLDILLYGDESIATAELQVPHPRMLLRKFVLAPLRELAPHLCHPSWATDVSALLEATPDRSEVRRVDQ